jgi:hypothetical protein
VTKPGGHNPEEHPLTSWEKAMQSRPLHSDPLTVDIGGAEPAEIVFRELSQPERDTLRMEAIDAVSSRMREHLIAAAKRGKGWEDFQWETPAGELETLIDNEQDVRILYQVVRDPKTKRRVGTMQQMRSVSPEIQSHVANLYNEWCLTINPDSMSLENQEHLWDAVKKNSEGYLSTYAQYGYKTAFALLHTLASLPKMSEIERFSDTPSPETTA